MSELIKSLKPEPGRFILINKILKRSNIFHLCFFLFKLVLLFFYLLGSFQSFTVSSTRLILRIIMSNDILILFFALMNIVTSRNVNRRYSASIPVMALSIFNIFFSLVTLALAFTVIVFTY